MTAKQQAFRLVWLEGIFGQRGKKHVSRPIRSLRITPISLPPLEIVQLILVESNQAMSPDEGGSVSCLGNLAAVLGSESERSEPEVFPQRHGRGIPASGFDFPTEDTLTFAKKMSITRKLQAECLVPPGKERLRRGERLFSSPSSRKRL